jgi:drug/metabolite transporter (DMT)-like permease
MGSAASAPSLTHARLCIALAAVFWSLSGAFTRVLTHDAGLTLGPEPVSGLSIAFFRALFGGLALLSTVRRADLAFRRLMLLGMLFFAAMNASFVLAMAWGKSSNTILLQYTAPMWMYLASVWWLGEKPDRRSSRALLLGLLGIAVILAGGWTDAQLGVIAIALTSGFTYAGVLVCLRVLRDVSPRWLTAVNHLAAALVLVPVLCWLGWQALTPVQLGVLVLFGTVQMALPYWLVARGLRVVSPQEAGTILLLEPLLNPLWAFLVAPARETPSPFTLVGGACILGALAWRYWPTASPPAR